MLKFTILAMLRNFLIWLEIAHLLTPQVLAAGGAGCCCEWGGQELEWG